jgi:hypothetical protein
VSSPAAAEGAADSTGPVKAGAEVELLPVSSGAVGSVERAGWQAVTTIRTTARAIGRRIAH